MNINIHELHAFFHAVAEMRKAQKTYFQHRTAITLEKAKRTEQAVDELLAKHQVTAAPDAPAPSQGNLWS